jgi:hypothetical protein
MQAAAQGTAIGYNPDDFTATGPGTDSGVARGIAQMVVTTLAQFQCPDGDSPYIVVESANPSGMAAIEAELQLQADPAFDPGTRVTPRIIAATHLVKGSFTIDGNGATVNLRIEDRSGNVVARATANSSAETFWEAVEDAARALAAQLCKEKEEDPQLDRYERMNQALRDEQRQREQRAADRVSRYAQQITGGAR